MPMTLAANTLTSRIMRGLGAQGFSQAVQIVVRLVEVPLLLSFWGSQLYGEWLMVAAIPAYLSVCDGGFAGAACREMSIRCGSGDRKGALAVFQSTWLFLLVVSLAIGLLAIVFVEVAPMARWLGFEQISPSDLKCVLLLLIAHVLIGFQGGLLSGGFWVSGRYPFGMTLQAATQLLEFGGLATAVTLGGGPVQAATGYLGGRLLGTVFTWVGQHRASSWLHYGFRDVSKDELLHLAGPAFASLAFPLGNAFNIQGMRLVVGLTLGPSAVAVFVPLRTLSRLAMQPLAIINRLIEPELALAFGAENISLFRRLFTRSCQISLWGCLFACLSAGLGAHWIFPVWTDGQITLDWLTYIALLAVVLVNSIWYTALMVPYSTNRHGRIAVSYSLVYGICPFGLCYLWAISLGLAGAALALLIAESVMAVIVIRVSLRMTSMDMALWAKTVLRPPFDLVNRTLVGMRKLITVTS